MVAARGNLSSTLVVRGLSIDLRSSPPPAACFFAGRDSHTYLQATFLLLVAFDLA
jgi:hypothetical protein